jgi:transcriptional regulator with XRE-family HTH domain
VPNSLELFRCAVRRILEAEGLTLREVAARAGIAPSAMSVYLSGGKDPSLATVDKIAAALRTTTAELLAMEPAEAPARKPTPLEALEVLREALRAPAPYAVSDVKQKLIAAILAAPEEHLENGAASVILAALDSTPPKRAPGPQTGKKSG